MDHLSVTVGQLQVPSSPSKTVSRAYAEKAAKTIFARYPNPKAGPEYLVELVNGLAEQPQWIVDRLADRHLGITAKHAQFVPSIGDVLDMISRVREMEERRQRYGEAQKRIAPRSAPVIKPFRPYPRLWDAFAGDADVIEALDSATSFDWLTEASKRFSARGKDEARRFICPPETSEQAA